ncbi:MAG: histidine kinase [Lachnospiraceae bacterium]|nr:histidine kinase [Lachnospiraceae bacterium]
MKNKSVTFKFFKKSLLINMITMLLPMLIIIGFSLMHMIRESNETTMRNNATLLTKLDDRMELFFTDLDNAYLILATDSDVSGLLSDLFTESETSLNSIRFANILSANFRNIVFTNDYVQNIYFYLNNDEQKILTTLNKRLTTLSDTEFAHISEALAHDHADDVWVSLYDTPPVNIDRHNKTMQIYRRLYYRATRKQSGLIIYSLNLEKLEASVAESFAYRDQMLLFFDANGSYLDGVNTDPSLLSSALPEAFPENYTASTIRIGDEKYLINTLRSERSYGLQYVLLTPVRDVYRFATTFATVALILFLCVLLATAMIAVYRTKSEHAKVDHVIALLSNPDLASQMDLDHRNNLDPFSYIQLNIVKLFLEQDYLKMQNLQKSTQLQLSQIKALQHQINPHFLNNTLNIIYWKSIQLAQGENECSEMLKSLSEVMRYSLSDPQEDAALYQELDFIRKYILLMKKRFPEKFTETFDIAEECQDMPIKKMLLQPLVENAINHGLRNKPAAGHLWITVRKETDAARVIIKDDGIGIAPEKLHELQDEFARISATSEMLPELSADHIGLTNTHLRLILAYGIDAGLSINSIEGAFTEISFRIPDPVS